jgi:hypothetical protein
MTKANIVAATLLMSIAVALAGCAARQPEPIPVPRWSFGPKMIFPADRSLKRPEDGVFLSDGRIVVADQVDGLRVVSADGSSRPFGRFAQAGYSHEPPNIIGAPNGVALEPAGPTSSSPTSTAAASTAWRSPQRPRNGCTSTPAASTRHAATAPADCGSPNRRETNPSTVVVDASLKPGCVVALGAE